MDDELLKEKYNSLLTCATELCARCHSLSCSGSRKLTKLCQSELAFLHRLAKKPMKLYQLNSTNLYHLQAVAEAAETLPDVTAVLHRVRLPSTQHHVAVDVVCCQGETWVKVVARNSKALTIDLNGDGEYGCKTLVTQACEYREAAQCHPHNFEPPRVVFLFSGQVLPTVSAALDAVRVCSESLVRVRHGASVLFHDVTTKSEIPPSLSVPSSAQHSSQDVTRVNLDVTTLISLVSNVCNGSAHVRLSDPVLSQQALDEQISPSLPVIRQFIDSKQWYVCQTAVQDFRAIVDVVGGPTERQRADDLLGRVTVVPDQPSDRAAGLRITSSIRPRARTVFGSGDQLKAVTTTANVAFVRAAAQAGVEFVTFLHPARALTECKEMSELEATQGVQTTV